jgi:hypothetical protein
MAVNTFLRLTVAAALLGTLACSRESTPTHRTFTTPEDAVKALTTSLKAKQLEEVVSIFGAAGQDLVDSSDPVTARRNRDVFLAAVAERWHLESPDASTRVLVIGNEDWPFPVPLVKDGDAWRFDTAAGKEEVLARRIGRNELTAILVCRTYVKAQNVYAAHAHDGQPAGRFAKQIQSDTGKENGLYWPVSHGRKRSPLGNLVAYAAEEGRTPGRDAGTPFHGYFFRMLDADASGFPALVAWPAQYDGSGVMTFIVGKDGQVHQKDLGADTVAAAKALKSFSADASWSGVQ